MFSPAKQAFTGLAETWKRQRDSDGSVGSECEENLSFNPTPPRGAFVSSWGYGGPEDSTGADGCNQSAASTLTHYDSARLGLKRNLKETEIKYPPAPDIKTQCRYTQP